MQAVFTLARRLARREDVRNVAVPALLVRRHGLGSLAARGGLRDHREDLARATVQWARTEQALPPIISALRAAGIRVAPIKGADYATRLYAFPSDRPMSDIDLLVHPGDMDTASRVLHDLGLPAGPRSPLHHATAHFNDDLAVDLHWNIIGKGRSSIDLDALWRRTSPGWPDGAERLEATDALLFHLVHLVRNRLRAPLVSVVDYARLREQASLPELIQRARASGLKKKVELALAFCAAVLERDDARLIGWPGPSAAELALLAPPTLGEKAAFDLVAASSPRDVLLRGLHAATTRAHWVREQLGRRLRR